MCEEMQAGRQRRFAFQISKNFSRQKMKNEIVNTWNHMEPL
jgi:hypothetical protein